MEINNTQFDFTLVVTMIVLLILTVLSTMSFMRSNSVNIDQVGPLPTPTITQSAIVTN